MSFTTEGKNKLKYILILAIAATIVIVTLVIVERNSGARSRSKVARAVSDMGQLRSTAEVIYGYENSYMNVSCDYRDVKILCDDIEENVGMKPIIHRSANKYCAYVKLPGEKEFLGEYYGSYWCVDSSLTSKQIQYFDPGSFGYCDNRTFRCPDKNSTLSLNQKILLTVDKFKGFLPIILGGIGLIPGCAILFWNYLRRKKGKKSSLLLKIIGITLLIISIPLLLFLILSSLSSAR